MKTFKELRENFAIHKNGKPLSIKGKAVTARSKDSAQKAIDTMMQKPFNKDAKFTIVTDKGYTGAVPSKPKSPSAYKNYTMKRKSIPDWRYAERGESVEEAVDKSSPVYKEYLSLKKKSIKDLRRMVDQQHRGPVDLSQYDKQGAISDLLRNQFGNKAVAAAMGLKEARQDSAKDVYWQSYSLAVRHALAQAKKKGFEVDEDDIDREITFGSGKPGRGKTVRHTLKLTKGGKPQKKALHIQVYNRDQDKSPFELNFYIS
jgi:hypothetical protein